MATYSIYFSPTGGTVKVAWTLTETWGEVTEVDLSRPGVDYSRYIFRPEDRCLIAIPVFEGRVPPVVMKRLGQMKAQGTPCVLAAVYGNRAVDDALLELKDTVIPLGFLPVGAVSAVAQHSSHPTCAQGRPDESDLAELRGFSARLWTALGESRAPVEVPGKRPYIVIDLDKMGFGRNYPLFDGERCVGCGLCASQCPVAAIDPEDLSKLDTSVCAVCMRCVSVCPTGARHVDAQRQKAFMDRAGHLFTERKPNTIYL